MDEYAHFVYKLTGTFPGGGRFMASPLNYAVAVFR